MSRTPVIAVGLVVVAGAAGFLGYRLFAERPVSTLETTVAALETTPAAEGSGEPEAPTQPTSAPVPKNLPDVTIPDRDGKPRKLSEWKGRPLLVNFWATWCAPCRKEIPLLEVLREERRQEGLEVIGIAVDTTDDVLKFAKEIGIDYPVLIADEHGFETVQAFGIVMAFPVSVFADKQARIVAVKVGELHADEADLILDRVNDVDRNALSLAEAQQQIEAGLQMLATERAKEKAAGGTTASKSS